MQAKVREMPQVNVKFDDLQEGDRFLFENLFLERTDKGPEGSNVAILKYDQFAAIDVNVDVRLLSIVVEEIPPHKVELHDPPVAVELSTTDNTEDSS